MDRAAEATAIVTELFDGWHAAMVRFAGRSVGNGGVAEEIVQEAFAELYKELRAGKKVEHPRAWVMRVIRRRVWREYAAAGREDASLEQVEVAARPMEEASELSLLMSHLSEREEEVVLLRVAGLGYAAIAEELGIAVGTVGALLAKALRKMQVVAAGSAAKAVRR